MAEAGNGGGRTSPWWYVGCGCLAALGLVAAAGVGVVVFATRKGREIERDMEDPGRRRDRALEVLAADALPEGYHPMVAASFGPVLDVAILSDQPPDEQGRVTDLGERGFLYFAFVRLGSEKELLEFFEGQRGDTSALRRSGVNVSMGERIDRGEIVRPDVKVRWVAHGDTSIATNRGRGGGGIAAIMLFECQRGRKRRMGVWYGPEPAPLEAGTPLSYAGTPADPAAIEAFLAPFHPCAR